MLIPLLNKTGSKKDADDLLTNSGEISRMLIWLAIFVILPEFRNKFSRILGAENLKG